MRVTAEQILEWHGSDHGIVELAEVMAEIANGNYSIEDFKQEVLDLTEE